MNLENLTLKSNFKWSQELYLSTSWMWQQCADCLIDGNTRWKQGNMHLSVPKIPNRISEHAFTFHEESAE